MNAKVAIHYFLAFVLTCVLLKYVKSRYDEANRNLIATTTTRIERTKFIYPTITVCGFIQGFDAALSASPWVLHARHDLVSENGTAHVLESSSGFGPANVGGSPEWVNRVEFTTFFGMFYCSHYTPPQDKFTPVGDVRNLQLHLNTTNIMSETGGIYIGAAPVGGVTAFNVFGNSLVGVEKARHDVNGNVIVSMVKIKMECSNWTKISTQERPCLDQWSSDQRDLQTCADDYFAKMIPCFGKDGITITNCTHEELMASGDIFFEFADVGETKFINLTGCIPPCSTEVFDLSVLMVSRPDGLKSNYSADTIVDVMVERPIFTIRSDYEVYSMSAMVGDIGGLAGILLGFSVLTFYNLILNKAAQIFAYFITKKRVKEGNVSKGKGNYLFTA